MADEEIVEPQHTWWAPDRYEGLDPAKEGAWKYLVDGSERVAVVWTDYREGAGIFERKSSPAVDDLREYFTTLKMMKIPAGLAYELLELRRPDYTFEGEGVGMLAEIYDNLDGEDAESNG